MKPITLLLLLLFLSACNDPEANKEQLMQASISGDSKSVSHLLENQVNPNCRDKCDWTPLMQATLYNHPEIVKKLLTNQAQTELFDQAGYTPLLIAATHNRLEIIQLLLEHGININHQEKDGGQSALIIAAKAGHEQSCKLLLKFKADPLLVDKQGLSALQWAQRNNHDAIIKLLK